MTSAAAAETLHTIALNDASATEGLGAALADVVRPPDVLALHGDLGAGKTTLARGLIRRLMRDPELAVPSPTFTLVEVYDTPAGPLWHFDLYRLNVPDDAWELGIEQAFTEAVSLIEWPERLGALLPAERLDVSLSVDGVRRRATLSGPATWRPRLSGLA